MANKDSISQILSPSGNPRVDAVDRANERLHDEEEFQMANGKSEIEDRKPMLSEYLIATALGALESSVCYCGGAKRRKNSFCPQCFYALPHGLRNRLYLSMSEGYAEIYDEAKDFLRIETDRIKKN